MTLKRLLRVIELVQVIELNSSIANNRIYAKFTFTGSNKVWDRQAKSLPALLDLLEEVITVHKRIDL